MTTPTMDTVIVDDLVRALSIDQVRHGEFMGHSIGSLLAALASTTPFSAGDADTATLSWFNFRQARVLGLEIRSFTAIGRTISVNAGVLVNFFGEAADVVGLSTWRIGVYAMGKFEAVPDLVVPAADNLWYLLEARVSSDDFTEARDVLTNPVTRTYASQVVTVGNRKRIDFNLKAGGASLPAVSAGWTPLQGFLNAAVIDLTRVIDLRQPLRSSAPRTGTLTGGALVAHDQEVLHRSVFTESYVRTSGGAGGLNSNRLAFDLRAVVDGVELVVATTAGSFVQAASFIDVGAPTANRFHYLYLAPAIAATYGEGFRVGNYHRAVDSSLAVRSSGMLIISTQEPDPDTQRNTANLAIPAPMAGNVAAGRALCVGGLFYSAAGWLPTWIGGNETRQQALPMTVPWASGFNAAQRTLQASYGDPITQPLYPRSIARHVSLQLGAKTLTPGQNAAGAGGKLLVTVGPPIGQVAYEATPNEPTFGSLLIDPLIQEAWQSLDVPVGDQPYGGASTQGAGFGNVYFNIATRKSDGTPWAGANGFLQDVVLAGFEFGIRCTGWRLVT